MACVTLKSSFITENVFNFKKNCIEFNSRWGNNNVGRRSSRFALPAIIQYIRINDSLATWLWPTGPCITTATWRCRKIFRQWEHVFHGKLCCHWLKFLRQRQIAIVIQGHDLEHYGTGMLSFSFHKFVSSSDGWYLSLEILRWKNVHDI